MSSKLGDYHYNGNINIGNINMRNTKSNQIEWIMTKCGRPSGMAKRGRSRSNSPEQVLSFNNPMLSANYLVGLDI